jgi:hypothetical protein
MRPRLLQLVGSAADIASDICSGWRGAFMKGMACLPGSALPGMKLSLSAPLFKKIQISSKM